MSAGVLAPTVLSVYSPYDGRPVGHVQVTDDSAVERAVALAHACRTELAALPAHRRSDALDTVALGLAGRAEEAAQLITAENGKPLKWARAEVTRAVSTFR